MTPLHLRARLSRALAALSTAPDDAAPEQPAGEVCLTLYQPAIRESGYGPRVAVDAYQVPRHADGDLVYWLDACIAALEKTRAEAVRAAEVAS